MEARGLLVTGTRGFVGAHVMEIAATRGVVARSLEGDCRERRTVADAIRESFPQGVVHLASSWRSAPPWRALQDDVAMAGSLLESLTVHAPHAMLLFAGSAAQYGRAQDAPLVEAGSTMGQSPYGVGKNVLETAVMSEAFNSGIRVVWARSFNHVGPGQRGNAPLAQWAAQVAAAEAGGEPTVRTGRLDVVRDVLDVRDVAEAYVQLATAPHAQGVYNVCSGQGVTMRELLDLLLAEARVPIRVEEDPALLREDDPPVVVGDPARLFEATGWQPRIALADSVRDVLDEARHNVVLSMSMGSAARGDT